MMKEVKVRHRHWKDETSRLTSVRERNKNQHLAPYHNSAEQKDPSKPLSSQFHFESQQNLLQTEKSPSHVCSCVLGDVIWCTCTCLCWKSIAFYLQICRLYIYIYISCIYLWIKMSTFILNFTSLGLTFSTMIMSVVTGSAEHWSIS